MSKKVKKDQLTGQIGFEVEDGKVVLPSDVDNYHRAFCRFLNSCADVSEKYHLEHKLKKTRQERAAGVDFSQKLPEELATIKRTEAVFATYYRGSLANLQDNLQRAHRKALEKLAELSICATRAGVPLSNKEQLYYDIVRYGDLRMHLQKLLHDEMAKPAAQRQALAVDHKKQEAWTDRTHIEGQPYTDTEYPYGKILGPAPYDPDLPEDY